jgi:hypothetical protein
MSTNSTTFPGQCEIYGITLYNFNKTKKIDLSNFYLEINITEEIFKPYFYGNITILDTVDILTQFPILGEEWIEISFSTKIRKMYTTRHYKCFVYKISDLRMNQASKFQQYTLYFISSDQFTNSKNLISRNFKGNCTDIIKSILLNDITIDTNLNIFQQTDGYVDFTIPRMTPFEAIEFFKLKSYVSSSNDTNYFLFFQDFFGYNFTSLSNLISEKLKRKSQLERNDISTKIYYEDARTTNPNENVEKFTRNFTEGSFSNINDSLDNLRSGGYKTVINYYDLNKRVFDSINLNYQDVMNGSNPTLDKNSSNTHTTDYLNDVQKGTPVYQFITVDSSMTDFNILLKKSASRIIQYLAFEHSPLVLTIYGDPAIEIGDIVEVELPQHGGIIDRTLDRYKSGNYMVGRETHNIQLSRYTMQLNLYKDMFKNDIVPNSKYLTDAK